jgi:hypothetical protein
MISLRVLAMPLIKYTTVSAVRFPGVSIGQLWPYSLLFVKVKHHWYFLVLPLITTSP